MRISWANGTTLGARDGARKTAASGFARPEGHHCDQETRASCTRAPAGIDARLAVHGIEKASVERRRKRSLRGRAPSDAVRR
jgi:hypothetical protein